MEESLNPSFHGEKCKYNGENIDFEIACDNCDLFLVCFPDWESADSEQYLNTTIETASDKALEAFLKANAEKDDITDEEIEIDIQVMQELYRRKEARGEGIDAKAILNEMTHGQGVKYFLDKVNKQV